MTDEQVRRENAARIARQLREKDTPLGAIFDPLRPSPDAPRGLILPDGQITFVADDIVSPHGGSPMRHYILDCNHGTVEDEILGAREENDGIVLQRFLIDLWMATGCNCRPYGWNAA